MNAVIGWSIAGIGLVCVGGLIWLLFKGNFEKWLWDDDMREDDK